MNARKFQKSERSRRRKAMAFTIIFHILLFGGLTFGTQLGDKIVDTVKTWFQEEEPVKNAALVKRK